VFRRSVFVSASIAFAVVVLVGWALVSLTAKPAQTPSRTGAPAATPVPSATSELPALPPFTVFRHTDYVALGDSYAAGVGGGHEKGSCARSEEGYPHVFATLAGVKKVTVRACSGATTSDLLANQLSGLSDSVNLITVSIGGNDLDVAGLAKACANRNSTACEKSFATSLKLLTKLPARLATTYSAIAAAAPNARVVVTGYPELFKPPSQGAKDFESIAAVDTAAGALNEIIASAVQTARESGYAFSFAAVSFAGHRIGSSDPWLNSSGPTAYHPTASGYRAYARAVAKDLRITSASNQSDVN
jgi:lysophospholipase L1-like esterase